MSADPVPPPAAIDPALQVRRQARLRRRRRRLGWTAAAVGLLLVIGWVFYLSPFLTVSRVNVEGAHVATDDQVRQAAGIAKGSSLAGLNAHAIEQRVAKLPVMASCHLTRSWPSAVTLQVTERKLVYQAQDAGSFQWTDETGAVFNMTKDAQQAPIAHLPGNASQQLRADVATALDSLTPRSSRGCRRFPPVPVTTSCCSWIMTRRCSGAVRTNPATRRPCCPYCWGRAAQPSTSHRCRIPR